MPKTSDQDLTIKHRLKDQCLMESELCNALRNKSKSWNKASGCNVVQVLLVYFKYFKWSCLWCQRRVFNSRENVPSLICWRHDGSPSIPCWYREDWPASWEAYTVESFSASTKKNLGNFLQHRCVGYGVKLYYVFLMQT